MFSSVWFSSKRILSCTTVMQYVTSTHFAWPSQVHILHDRHDYTYCMTVTSTHIAWPSPVHILHDRHEYTYCMTVTSTHFAYDRHEYTYCMNVTSTHFAYDRHEYIYCMTVTSTHIACPTPCKIEKQRLTCILLITVFIWSDWKDGDFMLLQKLDYQLFLSVLRIRIRLDPFHFGQSDPDPDPLQ